jgi:hypothetical protein
LNDYADGHLIDEMRDEIKNHLEFCEECRNFYNDVKTLISEASPLPGGKNTSKDFWEGITERRYGRKSPARIFTVKPEEKYYYEPGGKSLLYKDPHKKKGGWFVIALAAAAVLLGVALGFYFFTQSSAAFWPVEKVLGTPVIGSEVVKDHGMLQVGEWIKTDKKSRARLKAGLIGEVDILPNSRIQLLETRPDKHRINLSYGKINAAIWAPPGVFFVEIPSATVIDMGCMYNLDVNPDGSGTLKVTSGCVAIKSGNVESIVPANAVCKTEKSFPPGTPVLDDAPIIFKDAVNEFDFGKERDVALNTILNEAGKEDLLTLWHILSRAGNEEKEKVFNRIKELSAVPESITADGIINGNKDMMNELWESFGYRSIKSINLN